MSTITIFMVGDVMLGRGIDMIQEYSCDPRLYESNGLCAHDYVKLAWPIPSKKHRSIGYIWGDARKILEEKKPDVRIINLETSVTTSNSPWPVKSIHYKMHPKNMPSIRDAGIDCCVLSNNHTADWGFKGLLQTLETMKQSKMPYVGAGFNLEDAQAPASFNFPGKGRLLVFGAGHQSSGIPDQWQAQKKKEGLYILNIHNTDKAVQELKELISKYKKDGDVVVLSIHWGGNWGFEIEGYHQRFAHKAIEEAEVDVIHGHSSHHVKGVEVYKGKLILYGCGDFLNDYEGIGGHEEYRGSLALMYFADLNPGSGEVRGLRMVVTETKYLRVNKAKEDDIQWMENTMSRECKKLGCDVERVGNELHLILP